MPFGNTEVTLRVAMSNTKKLPDQLSGTFADNIGTNEAVVFSGPITLSSPSPQTTTTNLSTFDISIPLTTPFTYDPSKGSLLVDFKQTAGAIPIGVDMAFFPADFASRVFSTSPDGTGGPTDSAAEVMQLLTTPGSTPEITFNPKGGTIYGNTVVSISSQVAGEIRYTTDGSNPTSTSLTYVGPIAIAGTSEIRARVFVNGFPVSQIYSATYTKGPSIQLIPPSGLFTNSLKVTITNYLGLGTVRYTVDGSDPTTNSLPYTNSLNLTDARTIKAAVFVNNFPASEIVTGSYARVYALNDGISAAWRLQYFGTNYLTDPRAAADADPDADGTTNIQEFTAGSNPLDPNSGFRVDVKSVPYITWVSKSNTVYRVLRKSRLTDAAWSVVAPSIRATNELAGYVDIAPQGVSFYLIESIP